MEGEEASYFLVVDKKNYLNFGTAQDHKKVGENEKGQIQGRVLIPAPIIDKKLEKIIDRIVKPTIKALKDQNQF